MSHLHRRHRDLRWRRMQEIPLEWAHRVGETKFTHTTRLLIPLTSVRFIVWSLTLYGAMTSQVSSRKMLQQLVDGNPSSYTHYPDCVTLYQSNQHRTLTRISKQNYRRSSEPDTVFFCTSRYRNIISSGVFYTSPRFNSRSHYFHLKGGVTWVDRYWGHVGQLFDLRWKGHESKNGEKRTSAVAYLAFRFFFFVR